MTTIDEALQYVNQVYGQMGGVSATPLSSSSTVADYLKWVDAAQALALKSVDEAIAAAMQAAQYTDVSLTLKLLSDSRAQLQDLYAEVYAALGGVSPGLTLAQAWDQVSGEPEPLPEPEPPSVWPDDGAVVLYGDTPILLRAQDEPVLAGTEFAPVDNSLMLTSPETSLNADGSWRIGAVSGTGIETAYDLIKNASTSAAKGLLGEVLSNTGSTFGSYTLQAWEAYELGETITSKAERSIDFIRGGLDVLEGRRTLADWNAEHDAFLSQTENEFDTMAASALVSKVPVVGWVLAPVAEAYLKLSYQLKNTNSFEVSVSVEDALTGGVAGGVLLAGSQDDLLVIGAGKALAVGGGGNDVFRPGSGTQLLVGDNGVDTVEVSALWSSMSWSKQAAGYTVSSSAANWSLVEMERVHFADRKIALDFAPVAKILGAVFGMAAVSNQEYVGIGLSLLDGGKSYEALMQLALDARLGAGAGNDAVVNLLYTNVVGDAPSQAEQALYLGLLESGVHTRASLGVLAAETSLNAVNIDLLGLSQTGLEYL